MSTKSKLIIGIVLLAVGAGLVPTGLVANDYLRDEVYDGVPEAMIKIKRDAVSALEPQIPVLATPDVLLGVQEEATEGLEPMIALGATPEVLRGLRDTGLARMETLIEGAIAAKAINDTIAGFTGLFGGNWTDTLEAFMNDPDWNGTVGGFSPIEGVSEFLSEYILFFDLSLGYTSEAIQNLMYTGAYSPGYFYIPGILTDTTLGLGVVEFVDKWLWCYSPDPGIAAWAIDELTSLYGVTWDQLNTLGGYFYNYMIPGVVPMAIWPLTVADLAPIVFYDQWANGTSVPGGIDMNIFNAGVPTGTKGAEAGVPDATNITISSCYDLFNETFAHSFVNDTGIMTWLGAATNSTYMSILTNNFSINSNQVLMLIGWLNNFINNLTPLLIYADTEMTLNDIAIPLFYEQWANGTIMGSAELPGGFLAELDASFAGAPYFEVGLPNATGLSLTEAMDLWDSLEVMSFTDPDGFENVWLPAIAGDTGNRTALIAEFGISSGELTALLTWLADLIDLAGDPATGRVAEIIEFNEGVSITYIATLAVYEQWSEGTINGEIRLPEGFLSERDPPIYGPPYFEVSLTVYSLGLNDSQVQALWDESSEYSLLTVSGVNKWYKAEIGNTIYETLRVQNGNLAWWQMYGILEWLPQFRDNIVNKLAKDDRNLPMKPYELGETLALSLGIGGGALAALGIVFLILSRRT